MTAKKKPQRMCVGCREMKDKKELIRVVRTTEGEAALDFTGKKPGRGAYLCNDGACLKKAQKSRGLERALQLTIGPDVYEGLFEEINHE